MRLKKLTIENIASIEHAIIEFDATPLADEHLFLITGETGSGKSTIIDCLCLALYGNTPRMNAARRAEYENSMEPIKTTDPRQLLRRGTGKGEVTLTFDDNEGIPYIATWKVRRARNKVDGAIQPVSRSLATEDGIVPHVELHNIGEINERIAVIIGLDMDQFFRTVVLAQGKFAEFLNSDENEKAALLEKMTGTEVYAKIGSKIFEVFREKEFHRNSLLEQLKSITPMSDEEKDQINDEIKARAKEQTALAEQLEGAKKMLQWLNDRANNDKALNDKRKDLDEKQAKTQEAAFVMQQQLVADWDATAEPRHDLKDSQDAQRQIEELMGEKPAMQEEYDRLCAALRTTVEQLDAQQKQLDETESYLRQETANGEMYKNIKSIKDQLKMRQDEQKNLSDYTRGLQQDEKRQPEAEKAVKTANEAQQQQEALVKQLKEQYDAMNVGGINVRKDILTNAKSALQLLKGANDAVSQVATTLDGLKTDMGKEQHELELAQATLDDKRNLVKQAREAVDREKDMKNLLEQAHKSLHEGDKCPICGHVIDNLLDPHGENIIEALRNELKRHEQNLTDTETAIAASKKAINRYCQSMTNVQEDLKAKTVARDRQAQASNHWLEQCGKHMENVADNAEAEALITVIDKETGELNEALQQADALNRQITGQRDKLTELTEAHNRAKNDLDRIVESIKSQKTLIATTTERINSLTDNLNDLFTMPDWQERITTDENFVTDLARKAADFQAKETLAQSLRETIGKTAVLIPAMEDNKRNIKGMEDNMLTCEKVPANLDELWRQFENKNIDWNNRMGNERQKAEKANKALNAYLDDHPGISMERLTLLSARQQGEIESIRQVQKGLMDSITHDKGEISALIKRQEEISSQKPAFPEEDQEKLDGILQTGQKKNQELIDHIADLKVRLKKDEDDLRAMGEKKEALEKAEAEYQRWADFSGRLGSADGKTFRKIAQSYILGELLHSANGYLSQFNNRYELEANPGTLVILVRDLLQGDLTSASTLSGGESFMVSLALALALSSMSGKVFTVDTIFIDEGFGSLSADYLGKVMETLNRLYDMGGRRVGIISHVESLKEPITTQIQVKRDDKNNTVSRITVVG